MGAIDRYTNFGIKSDWVKSYFAQKDEFWNSAHGLGSKMVVVLKRFLNDCEVTSKGDFAPFGEVIDKIGIDETNAWALMLCNLAYTPEFNWWVKNTEVGTTYTAEAIESMLPENLTNNTRTHIVSAYKNMFMFNPYFQAIGLGKSNYEERNGRRFLKSITRGSWRNPQPLVILYSLFKFAESCGGYYKFTLTRLLDCDIESNGVSPTEIFGLGRDAMVKILSVLSIKYPDFISESFMQGQDDVTLNSEKTSSDVLALFEGTVKTLPAKEDKAALQVQLHDVKVQDNWIKLDLDNDNFKKFAGTSPVYCRIGDAVIEGENWRDILVRITNREIEKNNPAIEDLYDKPLLSEGGPYLMQHKLEKLSCRPLENGYWVNVHYSIPSLMKLIGLLCLHCGYAKGQIQVYGVNKVEITSAAVLENTKSDRVVSAKKGEDASIVVQSSNDNANIAVKKGPVLGVKVQDNWIKLDLDKDDFTEFGDSFPAYCRIEDEVLEGDNWRDILIGITDMEIKKNNPAMEDLYHEPLLPKGKNGPFLVKDKPTKLYYRQLSNGYWMYINYNIPRLMKLIKLLCSHCGYNNEQILIYGVKKGENNPVLPLPKLEPKTKQVDLKLYEQILFEYFKDGYCISSPIDLNKFISLYNENAQNGVKLGLKDKDLIEERISNSGVTYDECVYAPARMVLPDTREKLFEYIKSTLEKSGVLYYAALYKRFEKEFSAYESRMYSDGMLKAYLKHECGMQYEFKRDFMSLKSNSKSAKDYMKHEMTLYGAPMQKEKLYEKLPYLSEKVIETTLRSDDEFILNSKGEYFIVSLVDLSAEELKNIAAIINRALSGSDFTTSSDLLSAIRAKYPRILERLAHFSDLGIRNALAYYLKGQFSFRGNIISALGKQLSNSEIFRKFAAKHGKFTLDDLMALKDSVNAPTCCLEDVYDCSLRVSLEEFVSKDKAAFDVEKADAAISAFCTGDYISISDVTGFGNFPDVGFSWNEFLLEQYAAFYSVGYKLIHNEFTAKKAVGAIVKRASQIDDFFGLVADVLAKSGVNDEGDALNYLYDKGYIARRKYSAIEEALKKAKAKR